jgi:hypothetical protein
MRPSRILAMKLSIESAMVCFGTLLALGEPGKSAPPNDASVTGRTPSMHRDLRMWQT